MAKVRIELEGDETIEQAEENLFKALSMHRNGLAHREEGEFHDAAMQDTSVKMREFFNRQMEAMAEEINQVIDKEYE